MMWQLIWIVRPEWIVPIPLTRVLVMMDWSSIHGVLLRQHGNCIHFSVSCSTLSCYVFFVDKIMWRMCMFSSSFVGTLNNERMLRILLTSFHFAFLVSSPHFPRACSTDWPRRKRNRSPDASTTPFKFWTHCWVHPIWRLLTNPSTSSWSGATRSNAIGSSAWSAAQGFATRNIRPCSWPICMPSSATSRGTTPATSDWSMRPLKCSSKFTSNICSFPNKKV